MDIKINGKLENIPDNSTVSQILKSKKVRQEMVAVEINGSIINRDNYEAIRLKTGDVVEYLYYMGGGSKI